MYQRLEEEEATFWSRQLLVGAASKVVSVRKWKTFWKAYCLAVESIVLHGGGGQTEANKHKQTGARTQSRASRLQDPESVEKLRPTAGGGGGDEGSGDEGSY